MATGSPRPVIATLLLVCALGFSRAQTESCSSLPTSTVCGVTPLTPQQVREILTVDQSTVRAIEAIGVPIYEGSSEAAQLGLEVGRPIVELTRQQEGYYRRCQAATLLTTDQGFDPQPDRRRRKRQMTDNYCCAPSPNSVRILASVTPRGRAVEVVQGGSNIASRSLHMALLSEGQRLHPNRGAYDRSLAAQPPGLAQFFQDVRTCPSSPVCAGIVCGPVEAVIPAEVVILNPPGIGRENIVINVCGATTGP